jgi:hypothetical protein
MRITKPMARKMRGCRLCFVAMERIELADGDVVWLCAPCETMGDERHLAGGMRCWPLATAQKPRRKAEKRA